MYGYYGYYYDPTYLLLIPGLILALVAQALVSSAFSKWSGVQSRTGVPGAGARGLPARPRVPASRARSRMRSARL